MKEKVRSRALELGFSDCRFTSAQPPDTVGEFDRWLQAGHHGEMGWLERNAAKRRDPNLILPGARSVIVVASSYHVPEGGKGAAPSGPALRLRDAGGVLRGVVARYARFSDYHDFIGARLRDLSEFVDQLAGGGCRSLGYVDTGPVLERDLARRAGLGFVGKHASLVSRRLGNWFLIGEILTQSELAPDPPERNRCGSCTRCLNSCPTEAFVAPFVLDARRCISYLTLELKGSIPEGLRRSIGARIFGCDDCLAACPWNRFAVRAGEMRSSWRPDLTAPDLVQLLRLDEAGFRIRFKGTPVWRSKRRGLIRNVCVALGNVGSWSEIPVLESLSADADPLIAEHATWAVREIRLRCAAPPGATGQEPASGETGAAPF